jgi:prephenate dehydratase
VHDFRLSESPRRETSTRGLDLSVQVPRQPEASAALPAVEGYRLVLANLAETVVVNLPGTIDDIDRVYSHIQALGQAEGFLRRRPWQLLTTYNTAGAGKAIADGAERGAAAVLSPRAAGLFGLDILADEIGDLPGNRTRFLVLARPDAGRLSLLADGGGRRTTLVVAVRNEPGTLLAVLRVFADHALNMHKLESRPSRERAWEYVFWIDLDADTADPATSAALDELRVVTTMTRVLGCYPAAPAS